MFVEGGEENNNDFKIREPPVSFRSGIWKHFGFRVNVQYGKEVVEKEKTVCKFCHNLMNYKSGILSFSIKCLNTDDIMVYRIPL